MENACAPVNGFTVAQSSIDSINIEWSAAYGGVTDYIVKVYDGTSNVLETIEVTGVSYKYVPATVGEYGFKVGYVCEDTVWSDIVKTIVVSVCDAPDNLTTTTVTTTSAIVTWTGPALVVGYNVQVRILDTVGATPSAWATYNATENTYTIAPLEQGKIYEYRVQSKCGNGVGDTSDWSTIGQVTANAITCFAPENITVTPAYYSAVVSWSNNGANSYEYGYRWGLGSYTTLTTQDTVVTLENLSEEKNYDFRVRSICGSETSAWSDEVKFTTTSVPTCPLPTNLQASEITATSATLQWDAPADYVEFIVRCRDVNADKWDTIGGISAQTTRSLTNLTPNTAYTWGVKNLCDNNRESNFASADNFVTLVVGIEDVNSASTFKIYVSGKQINVINPKSEYVESIALTSANGAVLQKYSVRSRDNVLITTTLRNQVVIVTMYGKNGVIKSEKVMIK
jgi:hypothetical protein